MMRFEFSSIAPGATLWVRPGDSAFHAITAAEIERLHDVPRLAEALLGPWTAGERVTATGKPCKHGACSIVTSSIDDTLIMRVHRSDLYAWPMPEPSAESVAQRDVPATALRLVTPGPSAIEPARCEPRPSRPWAANERIGAIYVEREPVGTCRVSLVLTGADGKAKQVQSSTGLLSEDVGGAVELCARRLTSEAGRRATNTSTARESST